MCCKPAIGQYFEDIFKFKDQNASKWIDNDGILS